MGRRIAKTEFAKHLAARGYIAIADFGKLIVVGRAARDGRNPPRRREPDRRQPRCEVLRRGRNVGKRSWCRGEPRQGLL
jgi:nucleoid DNA-binding protein